MIVLPWSSREALLDEITHLESGRSIRGVFGAVGATRPVELTLAQKGDLLDMIDHWAGQTVGGYEALPEGIYDVRNAFSDDVLNAKG